MKKIHIFTLGGTIAYKGDSDKPIINGEDLVQGLPEIATIANVTTTSFLQAASSSLTIDDIVVLSSEIIQMIDKGIDGVVVTQGTDTIEETAFILDLLVNRDVPIVITGAMRNPILRGADGPANLLAAIQVVVSGVTKGIGAVVVFNDEIHSAKFVRKTHTQSVAAFQSVCGPIGWMTENVPRLVMTPERKSYSSFQIIREDAPVALYTVSLGDDGRLLPKIIETGYRGLVLEALGGGHVPSSMVEPLNDLAREIPVILASRTGSGEMLTKTYKGYPGSETSLLNKGLISAGWLDGRKSRILLTLLLMSGTSYERIREYFKCFSKLT
ncbi:asparaginase [Pseudalkalibacillus decolorationis]|uniref:asparaginase n=1 Tax=Pseudalkalibacillus decolorationis TaxID=163879 RepID=UPI0021495269|nr:asparaginase [Pseudalkalibacillus decolorationis]